MNPRLVIFDLDGVLVDSEVLAARAVAAVLTELGYDYDTEQVIRRFVGVADSDMAAAVESRSGRPLPDDFLSRIGDRARALFARELRAVAGADAVLAALPHARCVASNSPPDRIEGSLRATDLLRHFPDGTLFSAAAVARGKPAPDLFLHAAGRMAVPPRACVVVEDSVHGVTAAVAAGMAVLGFAGAGHVRDGHATRLREVGARQVFDDFGRLPDLLDGF